jgi:hypothetical protein
MNVQSPPAVSNDDELSRIGVAIPTSLLEPFDRLIEKKGICEPIRGVSRYGARHAY